MLKAIFYTVAFLAIQLLVGVLVSAVAGFASVESQNAIMFVTILLSSLVTIAIFLLAKWSVASRNYLLSRPYSVLFWAVLASLGALVPSMLLQEQMPELPAALQQLVDEAGEQMALLLNMRGGYFIIAILVPLTEELVFRGGVLRVLLSSGKHNHWLWIAVSALLFSLAHGNPAQMPHAFLIGLLLGWLYYRTGSILPGVVYHWANNTVAYLLFKLYPAPDIQLTDILGHNTRTIGAALIFSLFILVPALYQLHLRMRRV